MIYLFGNTFPLFSIFPKFTAFVHHSTNFFTFHLFFTALPLLDHKQKHIIKTHTMTFTTKWIIFLVSRCFTATLGNSKQKIACCTFGWKYMLTVADNKSFIRKENSQGKKKSNKLKVKLRCEPTCCVSSATVSARYAAVPRALRGANPGIKKCRRGKGTIFTASLRRSAFSWPGKRRHVVTPDIVIDTKLDRGTNKQVIH